LSSKDKGELAGKSVHDRKNILTIHRSSSDGGSDDARQASGCASATSWVLWFFCLSFKLLAKVFFDEFHE
jgi:hypothetical protein